MRNTRKGWISNKTKELLAKILVWIGFFGIILNSAILIWQVQLFIQLNNQFNIFSRLI
jgi:hypothetical protein